MNPHVRRINDDFSGRLIRSFEGGSVYESEKNDKFLVIEDQGTLLDLLSEDDRAGFDPIVVHEFETATERQRFLNLRGWVPRMTDEQQAFVDAQIFSMSLMATAQRNRHLYQEQATDDDKRTFRRELRKALESIAGRYVMQVTESQHIGNIESLARVIASAAPRALENGRFKIGAAQKALNLYLKYMWCTGRIKEPPHCPFDSIVLSAIGCEGDRWTEIDDIERYKTWVSLAKVKADQHSLAEWELREFNQQYSLAQ